MMENQVTSIEQSKRLLEMGIPAEKASMVWYRRGGVGLDSNNKIMWGDWELSMPPITSNWYQETIPAFTVADLLGMLPSRMKVDGNTLKLRIYRGRYVDDNSWDIWYERDEIEIRTCTSAKGNTLIDAAFEMVKTLCEDGKLFSLRLNKNRKYI